MSCDAWVGCTAELVEELKASHGFREWVLDPRAEPDAEHWCLFLMSNGGFAPIALRGERGQLQSGEGGHDGQQPKAGKKLRRRGRGAGAK